MDVTSVQPAERRQTAAVEKCSHGFCQSNNSWLLVQQLHMVSSWLLVQQLQLTVAVGAVQLWLTVGCWCSIAMVISWLLVKQIQLAFDYLYQLWLAVVCWCSNYGTVGLYPKELVVQLLWPTVVNSWPNQLYCILITVGSWNCKWLTVLCLSLHTVAGSRPTKIRSCVYLHAICTWSVIDRAVNLSCQLATAATRLLVDY